MACPGDLPLILLAKGLENLGRLVWVLSKEGGIAMRSLPAPMFALEVGARWTARGLSALLVGLVLMIFIGVTLDSGFHPLKLTRVESILMVSFWTACIGMVLAWRWQVIGGALSLAGMLIFFAVEIAVAGRLPRLPGGFVLYLMLLPGILFLMDSFLRRRMH